MHTPFHQNQKGSALIIVMVLFVVMSLSIATGLITPVIRANRIATNGINSKKTYFTAESGIEDVIYRLKTGKNVGTTQTISLNGGSATTTTSTTLSGKDIVTTGTVTNAVRNIKIGLSIGTGIAFRYAVQAGNGGFSLANSSSITGNVYSSGPITGSGNTITGDVISSGASGLVYGVNVSGDAYAHTIGSASVSTTIGKDAYYQTKTNTTVNGVSYPGSTDKPSATLPITDAQIADWETQAAAGGTLASSSCDSYSSSTNTCTISSSKSLGPKKIPFNLLIKTSSGVLTVTGPLWVTGNITTQTGPTIKMSSTLGSQNVAIIADNPSNTTGSGMVDIGQTTVFQGSGSVGSFVFMVSQNKSAETGGSNVAISMSQGSSALVAYAAHGLVALSQSVSLKETTGYKISLTQSANITYDTGLPTTVFSSGPSGGYQISSWGEQ